jgi:hypothetical protein
MRPSSIGAVWPEIGGEGLIEQPRAAGRDVEADRTRRGARPAPQQRRRPAIGWERRRFLKQSFPPSPTFEQSRFQIFLTGRQLLASGADNHETTKKTRRATSRQNYPEQKIGSFYVFI